MKLKALRTNRFTRGWHGFLDHHVPLQTGVLNFLLTALGGPWQNIEPSQSMQVIGKNRDLLMRFPGGEGFTSTPGFLPSGRLHAALFLIRLESS